MADYHTQFSSIIEQLTADEAAWLTDQLDPDWEERPAWLGELGESPEFRWSLDEDSLSLWSMEGSGVSLEQVGELVREFLARFRPNSYWSLTFAVTCTSPKYDAFGGGGMFITADGVEFQTPGPWVAQMAATKHCGFTDLTTQEGAMPITPNHEGLTEPRVARKSGPIEGAEIDPTRLPQNGAEGPSRQELVRLYEEACRRLGAIEAGEIPDYKGHVWHAAANDVIYIKEFIEQHDRGEAVDISELCGPAPLADPA